MKFEDQKKQPSPPSELDRIVQAELKESEKRMIKNQELTKNKSSYDVMQSFQENNQGDENQSSQALGKMRNSTLHHNQLLPHNGRGKLMDKKKDHMSATNLNHAVKMTPKQHNQATKSHLHQPQTELLKRTNKSSTESKYSSTAP